MRAPLALLAAIALVDLSQLRLLVERLGTISYAHCRDRTAPGCAEFERLEVRPDIDWEALVAAAKKTRPPKTKKGLTIVARGRGIDQYGGVWIAALLPPRQGPETDFSSPFAYALIPDFGGYGVDPEGGVEVLKREQLAAARAAQPKPKKGFRKLLD